MEMYFWNRIKGESLKFAIENVQEAKSLFISIAFCSLEGSKFILKQIEKMNLQRNNVEIILSKTFANIGYCSILQELMKLSKLYIKREGVLHAKVFMFDQSNGDTILIFGSGNLTKGGLNDNLEFGATCIEPTNSKVIQGFKAVSKYNSIEVTDTIINKIRNYEKKISDITILDNTLSNIIDQALGIYDEDPLDKSNLIFKNHLFDYNDYELFFPRFATSVDSDIIKKRTGVQEKLLSLLKPIKEHIVKKGYDLHSHWDKKHVTSLLYPCIYNQNYVGWLGIRLGKTKNEINAFCNDFDYSQSNDYGFQKHGCFQYSLFPDCFWVGIFHAVPYGAIDRYFLHEKIRNPDFQNTLVDTLSKLPNESYQWCCGTSYFPLDKSIPTSDFIEFYKKNDRDGQSTMIGRSIRCDAEIINKKNIVKTIIKKIDDLYVLYELIVKRYK